MATLPRKPGRPKDPELESRRRAEILSVAAKIFATHGFAATQVQTIAQELGIGNGTIYRYFATKEILFLAAVDRGLQDLDDEIEKTLAQQNPDSVESIVAAIRAYLGFFHRRPEMAELFIQERASFPRHHRPLYFTFQDDCEKEQARQQIVTNLVQLGKIREVSIKQFFSLVSDLLYGTILSNLLSSRPFDPEKQTQEIVEILFQGILTDSERRRFQKRHPSIQEKTS